MLVPSVVALDVNCTYQKADWGFIKLHYQCLITNITIEDTGVVVESVSRNHLPGLTDNDVKGFRIYKTDCFYMPQGMIDLFPNIEVFQIEESRLMEISQDDLKPFTELTELYLNGNNLMSLDSNLFEFSWKLKRVHLGHNKLRVIPADLLDPLVDLRDVTFNDNVCVNKKAIGKTQINQVVWDFIENCQPKTVKCQEKKDEASSDSSTDLEIENLKKMIDELRGDVDRLTAAASCCLKGTETETEE